MTAPSVTWVVGGGGLLGRAVSKSIREHRGELLRTGPIPWSDSAASHAALRTGAADLLEHARRTGGRWQLAWCAGAGVTGSTEEALADEVAALSALLDAVAELSGDDPLNGSVFIASSAGGVYAGASGAPFTEKHPVAPTSAYGRAKLAGERVAAEFARSTGTPVVVGRITNLYGPGQNLAKPQGLISHLCRGHVAREAISVYVSLDTIRDYLYVEDCADMVRLALAGAAQETRGRDPLLVKIFASHQGVTIGSLLGEFRRVFKRKPQVVLGTSPNASLQAADLRVQSTVWSALDERALTSLPAGLAATAEDLFRTAQLAH